MLPLLCSKLFCLTVLTYYPRTETIQVIYTCVCSLMTSFKSKLPSFGSFSLCIYCIIEETVYSLEECNWVLILQAFPRLNFAIIKIWNTSETKYTWCRFVIVKIIFTYKYRLIILCISTEKKYWESVNCSANILAKSC